MRLATIVATEPALAARLMRMANSAMMRRGPMELSEIMFIANVVATAGIPAAKEMDDVDAVARLRTNGEQLAGLLEEHEDEIQSMVDALNS